MMKSSYIPPKKILEKYANVLVNFALNSGKGVKKGEVVYLVAEESNKPLYLEVRKAIWKSGAHVISNFLPSNESSCNVDEDFYLHCKDHQLCFFPYHHLKGLIKQIDHSIFINSETDIRSLQNINPRKILKRNKTFKPWMDWRNKKENAGKFTWTVGSYGTEAMAREANMSVREYWDQIIKACFLNEDNPVARWKKIYKELEKYRKRLNRMTIDRLHIEGKDVDLWITVGKKRQWAYGSGRNIPSFEIFTSPDWRGTNGWVKFNQPLYIYGNVVEGIGLEFKDGVVVKSTARRNEKLLRQMIATEGADRIGEFSMTDRRFSHITRFMADTLYDENIGGRNGNTHIALGNSYHDCYDGKANTVSKKTWSKLGFNNSSVHTDIVTTTPRIITAILKDDSKRVIYKNGKYCF